MLDGGKKYGFVLSLYEYGDTIKTLWDTTKEWMKLHPEHLAEDKTMLNHFLSDNNGESYNLCHFWSNFEIGALSLWRSEAYRSYFDFLDNAGGFMRERWGDAPVHSIAAGLLLKPSELHFFREIGCGCSFAATGPGTRCADYRLTLQTSTTLSFTAHKRESERTASATRTLHFRSRGLRETALTLANCSSLPSPVQETSRRF